MNTFKRTWLRLLTLAVVVGISAGAVAVHASGHPSHSASTSGSVVMVAGGLNNPRNMTWGPNGEMLVAEAGTAGSACFGTGPSQMCLGLTGSVGAIQNGKVTTVASGLISMEAQDPGMGYAMKTIMGLGGIDYVKGHLYGIMDSSSTGTMPASMSPGLAVADYNQFGRVLDLTGGHPLYPILGDPGDYDWAWTYHHRSWAPRDFPDGNPYALLVDPKVTYVIDSSANTLDAVYPNGSVKILAFVPNPSVGDAVPTCVAQGKDGALYIGELTARGNVRGAAVVYRWTAKTGLKVWRKNMSAITGCGFGSNGDFYATEFDTVGWPPPPNTIPQGAVIQIAPNGKRTVLGKGQLYAPNGFLAGKDGSIYVANWSIMPGKGKTTASGGSIPGGMVVKITP